MLAIVPMPPKCEWQQCGRDAEFTVKFGVSRMGPMNVCIIDLPWLIANASPNQLRFKANTFISVVSQDSVEENRGSKEDK